MNKIAYCFLLAFILWQPFWLSAQTAPESPKESCPDFDLCLSASAYAGMGGFSCPHEETITIAWNTTCPYAEDAMLVANVTGGKLPYAYQWSNGGSGPKIEGLAPGDYSITVSDGDGCHIIRSTHISAPPTPKINIKLIHSQEKKAKNRETEMIQVTLEGTQTCYRFEWDKLSDTDSPILKNPTPGPHHVKITDTNGCVWEEEILVE